MENYIKNFRYNPSKFIGKGAQGTVYEGYDEQDNKVAIKRIPLHKNIDYVSIEREITILKMGTSKYMVRLIDYAKTDDAIYIIMEYVNGNSLEDRIASHLYLNEATALEYLKQICKAFLEIKKVFSDMKEENTQSIMHRDIKPANIIETDEGIKIVDLGVAKLVETKDEYKKSPNTYNKGSPIYRSPQMLNNEPYSCKTDVWSTGVTIYQLLFGEFPWIGQEEKSLLKNIQNVPLSWKSTRCKLKDPFFKILLSKMLSYSEEKRLSWEEIYTDIALDCVDLDE
jgi:serine/threonine-protein kinase ULK2